LTDVTSEVVTSSAWRYALYGQRVADAPPLLIFLVLGAGIGFVAGVSPGPVLTLVVQETLRGGWLRGAAVAAGPLLADGPIIAVALLLVGQFPAGFVPAISLVGGLFLLYLAVTTGLTARQAALPRGQWLAARGGLLTGVVARASSPNPYLFWVLVGTPALLQAGRGGWWSGAAFLVGYYSMIVGSNVGLALALHRWMGLLSDRAYRGLLLLGSALLAVYGLLLLGRGAQGVQRR
jgi:threonine/homoserine/homoserine lactone efflux protein